MKRVQLWRWQLHNKKTGRTYISHRFMVEAEALARDPQAVRIEWLTAWRWEPELAEKGESHKADRPKAAQDRPPRR